MKRRLSVTLVVISFVTLVNAQQSMFNLGDQVVNIGVGIGSRYAVGLYSSTTIPPLSISFEKAIVDNLLEKGVIGVGVYAGFTSYKWHYNVLGYDYGWRYSNIVIGARGSFHYPVLDNLDTYAGLMLGYNILLASEFGDAALYDSPSSGSIAYSGFVGGRYYFSDKFSAMAELGYGIAWLTLGLGILL